VAGVAAVLKALHEHGLAETCFADWGVIAGPCLMGRQASVDSVSRFLEEGAFAISPHLIPHESLHAISGTVSQLLGIHGPNFGVCGGPGAVEETLLTAATLMAGNSLPGLWVILTDYEPELIPLPAVRPATPARRPDCLGVALALGPATSEQAVLEICPVPESKTIPSGETAPVSMMALAAAFSRSDLPSLVLRLRDGGWLRLRGEAGRA
jgi:hypothetical protein